MVEETKQEEKSQSEQDDKDEEKTAPTDEKMEE